MLENAYIAGAWDSDGHISISRMVRRRGTSPNYQLVMVFGQAVNKQGKRELIKLMCKDCDGSRLYSRKAKKVNHSDSCYVHVCNENAIKLIRRLLPYLVIKKGQAKIALDFWDLKQEKFEQYGKYNPAGEEYAGNMETLKIAIHSLNSGGGFKSKI